MVIALSTLMREGLPSRRTPKIRFRESAASEEEKMIVKKKDTLGISLSSLFLGHTADLDIRVVDQDGEPWFVARDVSEALGLSRSGHIYAMSQLGPEEKMNIEKRHQPDCCLFQGRAARVALISEYGLYKLIMRSDKL